MIDVQVDRQATIIGVGDDRGHQRGTDADLAVLGPDGDIDQEDPFVVGVDVQPAGGTAVEQDDPALGAGELDAVVVVLGVELLAHERGFLGVGPRHHRQLLGPGGRVELDEKRLVLGLARAEGDLTRWAPQRGDGHHGRGKLPSTAVPSSSLAAFRERVLHDPDLQAALLAYDGVDGVDGFAELVASSARRCGFGVDPGEVQEALTAARRTWLERWV
jgi:hypothetical protein